MFKLVGAFGVTALLDAAGVFPGTRQEAFPDATEPDWARAHQLDPDAFAVPDAWWLAFHCFVIRGPGDRVTLVDTGVGPQGSPASWAPLPGSLPRHLAEAGIDPAAVRTVVLTHLHEDHYGWTVLPDGTPMFPNARHVVQRAEVAGLAEENVAMSSVVRPLRDAGLLHEIDGRQRLDRGGAGETITAIPTPGHTAGHQSVLVDGDHTQIVITGDVLVHAVQLANPEIAYRFEQDPLLAAKTRQTLLADARARDALLATAHLTQPFLMP